MSAIQDNGDGDMDELRRIISEANKTIQSNLKKKKASPTDSLTQLIMEGEQELEKDAKAKATANIVMQPKERYQMAHNQVLNDLPRAKREIVEKCILSKDLDNKVYSDFVREVIAIAESNEPQS